MMESIKVRQRVGQDGILRLDIPVGLTNRDIEVMVIYQPVQLAATTVLPLEDFYGICGDDPFTVEGSGISDALDDELIGVFE